VLSQLFGPFTRLDGQSMLRSVFWTSSSPSISRIVSESDVAAALGALERVRNDLASRREDAERSGVPEVLLLYATILHDV
jgi:hypothetical protein